MGHGGCTRIMMLGCCTDWIGPFNRPHGIRCRTYQQTCKNPETRFFWCWSGLQNAYRTQTRLKLLVRRWSGRFNQRFPKLWSARNLWAGCWKRSVFEHPYCQSTDQETLKKQYKDEAWQHCCRAKSRRVTECPWTESRHFDRYRLDGIRKEDC